MLAALIRRAGDDRVECLLAGDQVERVVRRGVCSCAVSLSPRRAPGVASVVSSPMMCLPFMGAVARCQLNPSAVRWFAGGLYAVAYALQASRAWRIAWHVVRRVSPPMIACASSCCTAV